MLSSAFWSPLHLFDVEKHWDELKSIITEELVDNRTVSPKKRGQKGAVVWCPPYEYPPDCREGFTLTLMGHFFCHLSLMRALRHIATLRSGQRLFFNPYYRIPRARAVLGFIGVLDNRRQCLAITVPTESRK